VMRRDYEIDEYRKLLERIRREIPGVAVSTDIITGFPGETEQDFQKTADFLKEARYDFAYLFKYSRRERTRAYELGDTMSEEEKGRRLRQLIDQQEVISGELYRGQIGEVVEVLVEGPAKRPEGWVVGKTRDFKTTVFDGSGLTVGQVVSVRVVSATSHTLKAERV